MSARDGRRPAPRLSLVKRPRPARPPSPPPAPAPTAPRPPGRLARVRARLALWRCAAVGRDVQVRGRVWIHGGGEVVLGDRVVLDGGDVGVELHAEPDGTIVVGDDVVLRPGASVEAQDLVVIGDRCELGRFARVMDNHFHPVTGDRHVRPASQAVRLGAGVVLGDRAVVLPGAELGDGVRLAADTVVGRKVGAGQHLAGVPPHLERRLS